jgi:hypothetical protein
MNTTIRDAGIFVRREYRGETLNQVAAALHISPRAVMTGYTRAANRISTDAAFRGRVEAMRQAHIAYPEMPERFIRPHDVRDAPTALAAQAAIDDGTKWDTCAACGHIRATHDPVCRVDDCGASVGCEFVEPVVDDDAAHRARWSDADLECIVRWCNDTSMQLYAAESELAAERAHADALVKELANARHTLANLGDGDLEGDAQIIALNAAERINIILAAHAARRKEQAQ